ncbi:hypothetical protein ZWY2020_035837 [Hordeum vulgare]|nr:hypothetical protein ZWY2020_035837 [Hordeum vulgare]
MPQMQQKVQKQGNHFYYPKCEKEPQKTCPRYKLTLEICDLSPTTTCTIIFFIDFEKDSASHDSNVEQMEDDKPILTCTKRTRRTRNTHHVVHSDDEESENQDSQEKEESISVGDKESKKKGIQKDIHGQADKLSIMKTIKQEPKDDEPNINRTKRGRRSNTGRIVHLDEEPKTNDIQEIIKSKSMEAGPKRKRVATHKCVGIDSKQVKNHHEEESE